MVFAGDEDPPEIQKDKAERSESSPIPIPSDNGFTRRGAEDPVEEGVADATKNSILLIFQTTSMRVHKHLSSLLMWLQ